MVKYVVGKEVEGGDMAINRDSESFQKIKKKISMGRE